MTSYRFSKEAKQDLKNIYKQGVVQYGEIQADIYFEALLTRFSQISDQPYLYPAVEHIREGYRRSVYGRNSIYYRVSEGVEIMRIIGQQKI